MSAPGAIEVKHTVAHLPSVTDALGNTIKERFVIRGTHTNEMKVNTQILADQAPSKLWVFFNTFINQDLGCLHRAGTICHTPFLTLFGFTDIYLDRPFHEHYPSVFKTNIAGLIALGVLSIFVVIPAEIISVIIKLVSLCFADVRKGYEVTQQNLTPIRATIKSLDNWGTAQTASNILQKQSFRRPIDVLTLKFNNPQLLNAYPPFAEARVTVVHNATFDADILAANIPERIVYTQKAITPQELPDVMSHLSPTRQYIIYVQGKQLAS